ncbi:tRNA glutamyl-Q(34) synthetase GluQRS, partial [Mycobacterium sp. ITM-2017-0098]
GAVTLADIGVPGALAQIADSLGYSARTVADMLDEFDPRHLPGSPWVYRPG